jgi:hypothetical protein
MADSLIDNTPDQSSERQEIYNKWKTKFPDAPPELLEAKTESDLFIKMQNARFDEVKTDYLKLREEHQAGVDLKTLIADLKAGKINPETPPDTHGDNSQSSLKPEDIDTLLEQKLTARELVSRQTNNFNTVKAKLKEHFGDNSSSVLKQRMDTLGLDQAFTDELAKNHPTVFFKTFGLDEQRQTDNQAPPRSSQRQNQFAPTTPKRDWNYYQELKKVNPRIYLDPKIAIQMHNDAIELGDAFGMPKD